MAQPNEFNWYLYEYTIDKMDINTNGEIFELKLGMIQSIYLEKDYDNDLLPIIMVTALISDELYYKIGKATNPTVMLSLKGRINVDGRGYKESTFNYINDTFKILQIDTTPNIDETIIDAAKKSSTYGEGGVNLSDLQNARTFILGKQSDLEHTKIITNTVLSNANMLTAASYALSQAGCSNVLMDIPDNNTMYKELMLLPIPLGNQLRYLNSYFGLYKQGAQIFFDIDRTYVVRKSAECTAYADTEVRNVVFCVYDTGTGNEYGKGSYTDIKNKLGYINTGSDQFAMEDLSHTANEYNGTNSLILNNNATASSAISNASGSFNIITTSTHNQYITNEIQLRLKELSSVVTIVTSNCDLRLLTPNKKFQILSTSSKVNSIVNRDYRLVATKVMFIKDGDCFCNVTEIVLKASDAK